MLKSVFLWKQEKITQNATKTFRSMRTIKIELNDLEVSCRRNITEIPYKIMELVNITDSDLKCDPADYHDYIEVNSNEFKEILQHFSREVLDLARYMGHSTNLITRDEKDLDMWEFLHAQAVMAGLYDIMKGWKYVIPKILVLIYSYQKKGDE